MLGCQARKNPKSLVLTMASSDREPRIERGGKEERGPAARGSARKKNQPPWEEIVKVAGRKEGGLKNYKRLNNGEVKGIANPGDPSKGR